MSYPIVRKVRSIEEQKAAVQAAIDDNDMMRIPSHVIVKDNQIVGAYNIASLPLVVGWHSTTEMKVRDTLIALNAVASIMNDRSVHGYFIASNSNAPVSEYMEKLGHERMWPTNLFYRKL